MRLPKEVRDVVAARARGTCEYCRLPQRASILPHQVDHIIGRQHQGTDKLDNLCLCCIRCNLKKGPNIASMDVETGRIVPLFHPRRESWLAHFTVDDDANMRGLTSEGRATVQLLDMNDASRVSLRLLLRRGAPHP